MTSVGETPYAMVHQPSLMGPAPKIELSGSMDDLFPKQPKLDLPSFQLLSDKKFMKLELDKMNQDKFAQLLTPPVPSIDLKKFEADKLGDLLDLTLPIEQSSDSCCCASLCKIILIALAILAIGAITGGIGYAAAGVGGAIVGTVIGVSASTLGVVAYY